MRIMRGESRRRNAGDEEREAAEALAREIAKLAPVLARVLLPHLRDAIAAETSAADVVDQDTSGLGRRMHARLCREGALPATKIGRRWLVRRADLDAYLAQASAPVAPAPIVVAPVAPVAAVAPTRPTPQKKSAPVDVFLAEVEAVEERNRRARAGGT